MVGAPKREATVRQKMEFPTEWTIVSPEDEDSRGSYLEATPYSEDEAGAETFEDQFTAQAAD
jgi:hypothetical protein